MFLKNKFNFAPGFLPGMEFWVLGSFNRKWNKLCKRFRGFYCFIIVLGWVFLSFSALNNCPSLIFLFRCQNSAIGATCRGLQCWGPRTGAILQSCPSPGSSECFRIWQLQKTLFSYYFFLSQRVSQIVNTNVVNIYFTKTITTIWFSETPLPAPAVFK